MPTIDLNCDMGESFGAWKMGNDSALMEHVTSVNIACGFHAGDPSTIRKTIDTAIAKGAAIGAHPSYQDLQGFGRRIMSISPNEVYEIVLYQVSALKGMCEALGVRLHHVKPHGALYNQAAKSVELSAAIVSAVKAIDPSLIFFGGSGTVMISEADRVGLRSASEVFADRTYQTDGTLTPRDKPGALIADTAIATKQALEMIENAQVTTLTGESIPIKAETICIHGDGPNAIEFAVALRKSFKEHNVTVQPIC